MRDNAKQSEAPTGCLHQVRVGHVDSAQFPVDVDVLDASNKVTKRRVGDASSVALKISVILESVAISLTK